MIPGRPVPISFLVTSSFLTFNKTLFTLDVPPKPIRFDCPLKHVQWISAPMWKLAIAVSYLFRAFGAWLFDKHVYWQLAAGMVFVGEFVVALHQLDIRQIAVVMLLGASGFASVLLLIALLCFCPAKLKIHVPFPSHVLTTRAFVVLLQIVVIPAVIIVTSYW